MSCSDCTAGNWLPGSPKGTEEDGVYLAKGSNQADTKDKAVVVLSDVFGLALPNPKIIADSIAERTGFDVWVLDLFNGNPPLAPGSLDSVSPRRAGEKVGLWKQIGLYLTVFAHIFGFIAARPSVVDPRTTEFLTKIKAERGYKSIGIVGYCFGGSICIRIAQHDAVSSMVIAHPSQPTLTDIAAINKPVSWICAEDDPMFPQKLRLEAEAHFKSRTPQVPFEFVEYPGTVHGFAARPAREHPLAVEGQEKALEQTVKWFQGTL